MSTSASINIRLNCEYVSPTKIINIFLDNGWTFNDNGFISYLPIGDNDDFNWQSKNIDKDYLIKILAKKEQKKELIGVVITWKDTEIGGQLLIWDKGDISISLTLNRKLIDTDKSDRITDVNWYLKRILPIFPVNNLDIESFCYEEHT
ncbi:MAG: hypothetical protein GXY86_14740 [Firmicutes bacterium]|nr:hypothetical protein [Bacillota bacterium]